MYRYPDGSAYVGSWAEGRKHGRGVYWDSTGGCLQGEWAKGELQGAGMYDQPAYRLQVPWLGAGAHARGYGCTVGGVATCTGDDDKCDRGLVR